MNRPLLAAFVGIAVVGGLIGAVIIASPGGEEEVVQQVETATPAVSRTPSPSPAATSTQSPVATETAAPTSTPSVPDGWLTYADPVLGFSLAYPVDLVLREIPSGNPDTRVLQFRSASDQSRSFSISIGDPEGLTPEAWLSENAACRPGTIEGRAVDGQPAAFCISEPIKIPETAVAIRHKGQMFYITSIMPTPEFDLVIASVQL